MPCVIIVVSKATSGLCDDNASVTSGCIIICCGSWDSNMKYNSHSQEVGMGLRIASIYYECML